MKTMANSGAIAFRVQKICMAQRLRRQKSPIRAMTIAAFPAILGGATGGADARGSGDGDFAWGA